MPIPKELQGTRNESHVSSREFFRFSGDFPWRKNIRLKKKHDLKNFGKNGCVNEAVA